MPALLAEPNLETLRPPGNPDELVCVGYRPVFKEHVNRAGKKIGQRELTGINNRCNERIVDTGDFAPLVIRHTRDGGDFDPQVIGFVGPYRMSKLGAKKPLPAIEGKVWVFREHVDALKKYPRLSVEFWADENDPGNGYFDPISLLGAETPELDLGVHYAKDEATGRQLMRYSKIERFQAVMPGGANTAVPSLIESDKEHKTSYGESGSMLSAADIQQIVAALTPVIKQQISEEMIGMKSAMGEQVDTDDFGGEDGLDLEGDSDLDIGDDLDGMGDEEGSLPDEDGDDLDLEGDDDDLPPEIDGEEADMGMGDDADLDEPLEQPGGDVADSDEDESDTPETSEADEEEEPMAVAEKKKPEQYAKENAELRERYHKAEARATKAEERLAVVEKQVAEIRAEKVKAQRYAKLNDLLNSGYVLTIDDELKDCEPLNDEQFGRHCDKIVQRYARVPVGQGVFVPPSPKREGGADGEKRERYAKVAQEVTLELRSKGKNAVYADVLDNVNRNEGKYVPAA